MLKEREVKKSFKLFLPEKYIFFMKEIVIHDEKGAGFVLLAHTV
jgi:hypothetical protein